MSGAFHFYSPILGEPKPHWCFIHVLFFLHMRTMHHTDQSWCTSANSVQLGSLTCATSTCLPQSLLCSSSSFYILHNYLYIMCKSLASLLCPPQPYLLMTTCTYIIPLQLSSSHKLYLIPSNAQWCC